MGSVIREIIIDVAPDLAWQAVADVGNVHTRLVPGFVRDTELADGIRTVTFVNGVVLREAIVSIDDERRRIAYARSVARRRITTHRSRSSRRERHRAA